MRLACVTVTEGHIWTWAGEGYSLEMSYHPRDVSMRMPLKNGINWISSLTAMT